MKPFSINVVSRLLALAILSVLSVFAAGCITTKNPKLQAWAVTIKKATPASIEVDLIGVTPLDKPQWLNVKPDDWFKPGNSTRENYTKNGELVTTRLQSGQHDMSAKDPIWRIWIGKGSTELLILADLPGRGFSNGPDDPRRRFLPLDKRAWGKQVRKEGVLTTTIWDEKIHFDSAVNPEWRQQ